MTDIAKGLRALAEATDQWSFKVQAQTAIPELSRAVDEVIEKIKDLAVNQEIVTLWDGGERFAYEKVLAMLTTEKSKSQMRRLKHQKEEG